MKWEKMKKDELIKKCKEFDERVKELEGKIEDLEKKNKELEDYAKRLKAQFENYKREAAEDKKKIIKNANEYLISKITTILDDFERALKSAKEDDPFVEGMRKIYKKFISTLESEGLSIIDPSGKKFDPFEHEAFEKIETEEHDEYSIIEVVEKGYKFHSKVIKPAKVKVAVKPKG